MDPKPKLTKTYQPIKAHIEPSKLNKKEQCHHRSFSHIFISNPLNLNAFTNY